MIIVTDVLTNKTWNLPNSVGANPININQYPPGRYDITNGSTTGIAVIVAPGRWASIPVGATWNIASQDNDRSYHKSVVDNVIWQHSGRFN